jgi:hypothetical protein
MDFLGSLQVDSDVSMASNSTRIAFFGGSLLHLLAILSIILILLSVGTLMLRPIRVRAQVPGETRRAFLSQIQSICRSSGWGAEYLPASLFRLGQLRCYQHSRRAWCGPWSRVQR